MVSSLRISFTDFWSYSPPPLDPPRCTPLPYPNHQVQFVLAIYSWVYGRLPELGCFIKSYTLKENKLLLSSNHQLSIALLFGVDFVSSVPLHSLVWPRPAIMCAVTNVMSSCAAALLCLGNTVSLSFSTSSDSYILSTTPPFPVIPLPRKRG